MSGHSKWHKVKHKKAATDSKKSKLFGQLARDIKTAARAGRDPNKNSSLREAVDRARKANLPQENIDRLLQDTSDQQETIIYEGYGPGGIAVLVVAHTDNGNRTVAELRSLFKKHGGNLGEPGSVRWKFHEQVTCEATIPPGTNQDDLELKLIEAGADDIQCHDQHLVVTAPPTARAALEKNLAQVGADNITSIIEYVAPATERVAIAPDKKSAWQELEAALAAHADIVEIYTDATDATSDI